MPAGVVILTQDPVPDDLTALLAASTNPVWAIDAHARRVIATNQGGAERLGKAGTPEKALFDAARDVLASAPNTEERRDLLKTSPAPTLQGETTRCIETASWQLVPFAAPGSGIVLVEFKTGPLEPDNMGAISRRKSGATSLRDIARQIRAGRAAPAQTIQPPARNQSDVHAHDPARESEKPETAQKPAKHPSLAPDLARPKARLAHEIKTPLSAIAAAAEVMRDEQLGPMGNQRYSSYAAGIAQNAKHALEIINRMMSENAAAQARKTEPSAAKETIDLNKLCESVTAPLVLVSDRAGITLKTRPWHAALRVYADATEVRQVLNNLLTNAIKFTPAGGGVMVSTGLSKAGDPTITVRDAGRGMTRAEIARALDKDDPPPPANREGGGLGLGLPLVRSLAEANGAEISIDSILGKGTSVTLIFRNNRRDN